MLRTVTAVAAGKAARIFTRLRGGGSALPGLVVERVDPSFLNRALSAVPGGIVVVSGTNGKTTTTKMLTAILRAHGKRVFTNPTGSNFTRGVISSLLGEVGFNGQVDADIAVVELDEAHSLLFAKEVRPTHALLLNVARDQLDRFAEIDHTADLLGRLATSTLRGLVLNRDDSFISRIAHREGITAAVDYFGVHPQIADRLPELLEADLRSDTDVVVPPVGGSDGLLRPQDERRMEVLFGDGVTVGPVELRQRGLAAMINATAAVTMARQLLGTAFDGTAAVRALREVAPPFGRGEVVDINGQPLELVLVKNPAGFTVALGTYGSTPVATMIAINDDYADGRDVSWLYDVSFDSLASRGVAATSGVRAYDMAVRLHYDGIVTDKVEPDLTAALDHFLAAYSHEPKRIFCTYTAMMALRKTLAARYGLAAMGEDPAGESGGVGPRSARTTGGAA
ncbi:Lipid II isoglutaminyl synthase (glutamine-hydrolyzing) subunit MurT [Austwickia sp. TVS 96-490-7B]|uniref:Mur ligase family protein n=1 Tax=Austwickia sp. TVS 96-490-7B TaxID=2830843 RepID=UPI001C570E97|nr:Mur ligase family protein [Austwickia sp. TVS 96-490-7B]MBW3084738.1 Lipid II isoglutaminyl synthase (glutamine-hydrolyzing) subunit MurT [Austwickia sp. TVS 96-490-7B]